MISIYALYFGGNYAYVGSTVHFEQRIACHLRLLSEHRHYNKFMQRVYDKHGFTEYKLLETNESNELRQQFETKHANEHIALGYNLCNIAPIVKHQFDSIDIESYHDFCNRQSKHRKQYIAKYGISNETRSAMSSSAKQKFENINERTKVAKGVRKYYANNPVTDEFRQKVSLGTRNAFQRPEVRKHMKEHGQRLSKSNKFKETMKQAMIHHNQKPEVKLRKAEIMAFCNRVGSRNIRRFQETTITKEFQFEPWHHFVINKHGKVTVWTWDTRKICYIGKITELPETSISVSRCESYKPLIR